MAEEKQKFKINFMNKKINNSREIFLSENENLIIGKKGLTFQYYPTKNEKLKYYLNKKYNINKLSILNFKYSKRDNALNKTFYKNKKEINNKFLKDNKKSFMSGNMPKSMSQTNFFKNKRKAIKNNFYKNDICDDILEFNENKYKRENLIDKKKLMHIPLIQNYSKIKMKSNFSFDKNSSQENSYILNNRVIKNNNNFKIFSPIFNIQNKFRKIIYQPLSKLESPKITSNKKKEKLSKKTHFKGLESIYINPKEIYELFKKEDEDRLEKLGYFNINEKKEKEQEIIEKKNEYKEDIKELIEKEENIQNIINSKEFSDFLGNNKLFKEAEYKEDISNYSSDESKIKNFSDKEEENNKMNYLKKIAFEEKKIKKFHHNNSKPLNNIKKKINLNKKEIDNEDYSFFEEMKKSKKKENINILMEMEDQLRVEGKVYHMKNEIDKICKELLNKYKIYKIINK